MVIITGTGGSDISIEKKKTWVHKYNNQSYYMFQITAVNVPSEIEIRYRMTAKEKTIREKQNCI